MAQRPSYDPDAIRNEGDQNEVEKIDYNIYDMPWRINPTWRFLPKNNQRRILVKFLKKETINQLIEIHETKNLQYFKKDDLKEFFNYFNVFDKLSEFFINIDTGWRKIYLTDKLIPTINLSQSSKNLLEKKSGLNNIRLIYDIYRDKKRTVGTKENDETTLLVKKDLFTNESNKYNFDYKNYQKKITPLGADSTILPVVRGIETKTNYLNKLFSLFTNKRVIKEKEDEEEFTEDSIKTNTKHILLTCDELQDQKKIYYAKIAIDYLFQEDTVIKPKLKYLEMLNISKEQKEFFTENKSFNQSDLRFDKEIKSLLVEISNSQDIINQIKKSIKDLDENNSFNYLSNKLEDEEIKETPEEITSGGGIFRSSDNIQDKESGIFSKKNMTNEDKRFMIELIYYLTFGFYSVFKASFRVDRTSNDSGSNKNKINEEEKKQLEIFFKPFIENIMSFLKNNYRLIHNNSIIYLQAIQFLLDFIQEKLQDIFNKPIIQDSKTDKEKKEADLKTRLQETASKKKYFNSLVFFNTYNKKIIEFIMNFFKNIDEIKKLIKSSTDPSDRASNIIDYMNKLFSEMVYDDQRKIEKLKEDKKLESDYTKVLTALFPTISRDNFNIKKINSKRFDKIIDDSLNMDQLMYNLDNIIKEIFQGDDTLKVDTNSKTVCLDFNNVTFEEKKLTESEKQINIGKIEKLQKEIEMLRKLNN